MPQFLVTMNRQVTGTRTVTVLVTAEDQDRAREGADAADMAGAFPEGTIEITEMDQPTFRVAEAVPGATADYTLVVPADEDAGSPMVVD